MQLKKTTKIISVVLAVVLMLSALPLNFLQFLNGGKTYADENDKFSGIIVDADTGKPTNKENATYVFDTSPVSPDKNVDYNIYMWLSEGDADNGRNYKLDIYSENEIEFQLFGRNFTEIKQMESISPFPIQKDSSIFGNKENVAVDTVKLDAGSVSKYIIKITKNDIEFKGDKFLAIQIGEEKSIYNFPIDGLACSPIGDITVTNAQNNVITYSNMSDLKIDLSIDMDGPFELYLYNTKIKDIETSNKTFSEIIEAIDASLAESDVKKSNCYTFTTQTYTINDDFLNTNDKSDYTIILKDKYNNIVYKNVSLKREVKRITTHLVTSPKGDFNNADATPIFSDINGNAIENSVEYSFVSVNSEFSYEIPEITGYTFVKSDIGTVKKGVLSKKITTDLDIYLYYETLSPNLEFQFESDYEEVYPKNDFSKYPNSNKNTLKFDIVTLANNGNINFDKGSVIIKLPQADENNAPFTFDNLKLTLGTFKNVDSNSEATISVSSNGKEYTPVEENIALLDIHFEEINLPKETYFIKIEFNQDAIKKGFYLDIPTSLTFDFDFESNNKESTLKVESVVNFEYTDYDGEQKNISKNIFGTTKIINPINSLRVEYIDVSTNMNILNPIDENVKFYSDISDYIKPVDITGYKTAATDFSISIPSKNNIYYMPNGNLVIRQFYYAKQPYMGETAISTRYDGLFIDDKETFFVNDLGAYYRGEGQGDVPMYVYELLFNLPKEIKYQNMEIPTYQGKVVKGKMQYKFSDDIDWTDYTTDANGKQVSIRSDDDTLKYNISNMYNNSSNGYLQIKIIYGTEENALPADFQAEGTLSLTGSLIDDTPETIKMSLKTSVTYFNEAENKNEVYSQMAEKSINIKHPSVANATQTPNLTILKGEYYSYNFANIKNDGNAELDYNFSYEIDEKTYFNEIRFGRFEGIASDTVLVRFKDKNGNLLKELDYSIILDENYEYGTLNVKHYAPDAKKIEIDFGQVSTEFNCGTGIEFILNSVLEPDEITKVFFGKAKIDAEWISDVDNTNAGTFSKEIETKTTVTIHTQIASDISLNKNTVLPTEELKADINNFNNSNHLDLFNVKQSIFSKDNSTIVKASTGAYNYESKNGYEQLIIYAENLDGTKNKIFDSKIPQSEQLIDVPVDTIKVIYVFSVMRAGFKTTKSPYILFQMNGKKETYIDAPLSYRVGAYATDIKLINLKDAQKIGTVYTSEVDAEKNTVLKATPSITKPLLSTSEKVYFSDTVKYEISNIENNGNISLFQNVFNFVLCKHETIKSVNIGKWSQEVSGYIGYVAIDDEDNLVDGTISKFDKVKEFDCQIENPNNLKITAIYIVINNLSVGAKIITPAFFETELDKANVKPNSVLDGKFTFVSHYGIVADSENITNEELVTLEQLSNEAKQSNIVVVKPSLVFPSMSVSSENIEYRAPFEYVISNIKNDGNTSFDEFEIVATLSSAVRFTSLQTPTFNELTSYDIYYRTNISEDWVLLQKEINAREENEIYAPELTQGEYVQYIKFSFSSGVQEGFMSTSELKINCLNWSDAYSVADVIFRAEVNGKCKGEVISSRNSVYYTPEIPSILQSGFTTDFPEHIYPNQEIKFVYKNIKNVSETTIMKHNLTQLFTNDFEILGVNTGSYEEGYSPENLQVLYKTNKSKDNEMFILKEVPISENSYLEFPELDKDEYITQITIKYGDTKEGFAEIESPSIIAKVKENIKNSSTIELNSELLGYIDGKSFGEFNSISMQTNFGFVNIIIKDTNGKVLSTYKEYGTVGDSFDIAKVTLKGYETISATGDTKGTYVLNESGTITFVCKEIPKTGYKIVTDWKFILGSTILLSVGVFSLFPKKKKEKMN